jgi:methylmalonyl-CoA mutase N-terminal domain/subunit
MTINATASVLLAMVLAVARRQGVPWSSLSGTVQNDILKEYIARGTYRFPPRPSLRLITDVIGFCAEQVPKWNTISISGYHIREAGSTAVQEVAFTLANAREYVRAAVAAGLGIDDFAPRISFFFNSHNNFLEEVAKFRAARRMWARMMREEFGAADPRSWLLRFHTQTAGSTLTAQQPETNVVRVAMQALAAVAGGTQSLHTNAMDEALALPTESSARLALRTQQVIAYESGVADVADPLGGAYVIEAWTDRIEAEARDYIGKIESMGGALAAIERGFQQREIHEAAYGTQRAIESGEQVVVGVNRFRHELDKPIPMFRMDPSVQQAQIARLAATKRGRDAVRVRRSLAALEEAARGSANLMPQIVDAVDAPASLGEIAGTLAGVFGEHRDLVTL